MGRGCLPIGATPFHAPTCVVGEGLKMASPHLVCFCPPDSTAFFGRILAKTGNKREQRRYLSSSSGLRAKAVGIEPTSAVLETAVLPLNYALAYVCT